MDVRCPNDGEMTNERCWKCGWTRGDMDDLITWLRAQLDEREQQLEFMASQGIDAVIAPGGTPVLTEINFGRRDIDAKRRILDEYEDYAADDDSDYEHAQFAATSASALLRAVQLLALPYAGRDGWREEWTPTEPG